MERLTYTNSNGQSVALGNTARPFMLLFVDGTGSPTSTIQTQKAPFQDGSTYIDTVLEPREITFEVGIFGSDQAEVFSNRKTLCEVFNPKNGVGQLLYEYDGGSKLINATVEMAPVFPSGKENKATGYQKAMFSLLCLDPLWEDETATGYELSVSVPLLAGPIIFKPTIVFSALLNKTITIENIGDVSTPVKIIFYGPATNPIITNETTDEFIQVNKTLTDGQSLEINTAFGSKYVTLVDGSSRTNAFGFIDLDSTFFNLAVGDNTITYDADSGADSATMTISYKNKYVGV
jgi:hypothetical protein